MSCTTFSPVAYSDSNWVAGWLPIRYKIHSNKWPVNSFDDEDTISSIADNGGFARVTLSSTFTTYVVGETIKISGASVTAYNGVWTVKTVHSATDITISAPYSATDTGTFQRYYQNYAIKVRVYTGIPSGHSLNSTRPMALKGTMTVVPDASGDAEVDISGYVHADFSPINNRLCEIVQAGTIVGNDHNMWTGFYIEYAESYNTSDGTDITTETSSFITDLADDGYTARVYFAANAAHQFQYYQGRSMGEYAVQDVVAEEFDAKFMTAFTTPTYFLGNEFDLSIILAYENISNSLEYYVVEYDSSGALTTTTNTAIASQDDGIYRFSICDFTFQSDTTEFDFYIYDATAADRVSEVKRIKLDRTPCGKNPAYIRWLNPFGGWEGFLFTADHERFVDVQNKNIVGRDIFQNWDAYFSVEGDTEDDVSHVMAYEARTVRSQFLTTDQKSGFRWLWTSPKIYEVYLSDDSNCGNYRQTTIILEDSRKSFQADGDKLKTVTINYRYSDKIRVQGQ